MKILSLFSGIGGFDLAFRNKGHTIIGACEIDKYARSVYSRHFPGVRIYQDATKINPEDLEDFDCLCAGFPCQAFSIAGKRLGFEESRGTLFFEIARIARQKRPRLLLLENVKGLLSHDRGKTFAVILTTLDELGYDAEWQVLNSKYFVPQNRERIFIIGYLRGEPRPKVFPIGENIKGNNSSRYKTQKYGSWIRDQITGSVQTSPTNGAATMIVGAIDAVGSLPFSFTKRKTEPKQSDIATYLKSYKKITFSELSKLTKIKKTKLEHYFRIDDSGALPDQNDWMILKKYMNFNEKFDIIMTEYVEDIMTHEMGTRVHKTSGIAPTLTGDSKLILEPKIQQLNNPKHSTNRLYDSKGIARTIRANAGGIGAKTGLYAIPVQLANHNSRGRRMKTHGENTFTLDASAGQGLFDGKKVRRLTPLECERLQGFPDNYTEGLSDNQRYKCLGNAVTVPVIEYIIERLDSEIFVESTEKMQ